ncbi:MAG: septum formation protein Maf [Clostridiales bacterium]|nr:septum formation protein Maf [Clostridiales bacterium]
MRVILASLSPRRKELMNLIIGGFDIEAADIDERAIEESLKDEDPLKVSEALALEKALAIAKTHPEDAVIGADTSVIARGKILGKPLDKYEAREMLTMLSGIEHVVATGVAVVIGEKVISFTEETKVKFYDPSSYMDKLIEDYISTPDPYDKAGGYGIQTQGALLVEKIDGDYLNVVGLPVSRLARVLSDLGIR